jgi:glycerol-3-phosphate acyltransferase PlsY
VIVLTLSCLAFLLGSFPSGLVLARAATGRDVRRYGSGNIGASNVSATAGWWVGLAVGVLDVLKGVLPVLLARLLGVSAVGVAIVALAAVLGHNFSLFLRFRGGKGVATSFGASLVVAPLATLLAAVTWVLAVAISRYASVASLTALAALPIYMALTRSDPAFVVLGIVLFLLAAARHWENILRLVSGTETKIGSRARRRRGT